MINCSKQRPQDYIDCILDLREFDVPYHVRFSIDNGRLLLTSMLSLILSCIFRPLHRVVHAGCNVIPWVQVPDTSVCGPCKSHTSNAGHFILKGLALIPN